MKTFLWQNIEVQPKVTFDHYLHTISSVEIISVISMCVCVYHPHVPT